MVLKVFKAADAFTYLPVHIAGKSGLLQTLLPGVKIEFIVPQDSAGKEGDAVAIEAMHKANNSEADTIAVAICSPSTINSNKIRKNADIYNNCRIVAKIINRLPFWGINHKDIEFSNFDELELNFESVIHYNKELTEGFYLGVKISNGNKNITTHEVPWSKDIDTLESKKDSAKTLAISGDIVKIARATHRDKDPLKINYRFSKHEEFLTTGIITSKKVCENHHKVLTKIIESIQKSINLIYSSEKIAIEVCDKIRIDLEESLAAKINLTDEERESCKNNIPTENELPYIVQIIREEEFYPENLNILEDEWAKAVIALSVSESWTTKMGEKEIATLIKESYRDLIDKRALLESENSIAKQFGIDSANFVHENKLLKQELQLLKNPTRSTSEKMLSRMNLMSETSNTRLVLRCLFLICMICSLSSSGYALYDSSKLVQATTAIDPFILFHKITVFSILSISIIYAFFLLKPGMKRVGKNVKNIILIGVVFVLAGLLFDYFFVTANVFKYAVSMFMFFVIGVLYQLDYFKKRPMLGGAIFIIAEVLKKIIFSKIGGL